jgi:multiple sugar transport system substrate-binding protein
MILIRFISIFFLALAALTNVQAKTTLSLWYHGAGNDGEIRVLKQIINDFNHSQLKWKVVLESFPQGSYNDSVSAAALARNLPDIVDVDGPVMPKWAWSGYLQPLQIDEKKIEFFLRGAKGVWNGKLYSIGLWDAAVSLVTRQSTLDELGLRKPTLANPWNRMEFMRALEAAKASGKFDYALDLGMAWTGEWYSYAYSPFLQSFGGDIVDRTTYQSAENVLNGNQAITFGKWWQSLFLKGYSQVTQDPADRDNGFANGKYAFSWNGNWAALDALDAYQDVLFLPAPDFGNGGIIGASSWQFGISATSKHPEGANAFIEFALNDKYLAAFSNQTGLIPATPSAATLTENYKPGRPLSVFLELSRKQALVRPVTPGYVVASKVFEKALSDIANGADVIDSLDAAVDEINFDIESNSGYGHRVSK